MTASGGANAHDLRATVVLENIRGGLGAVVRPPRSLAPNFVPVWRRLQIQGAITVCAVALSMLFLDVPGHDFAAGLPLWLVDIAYEITDFGRS